MQKQKDTITTAGISLPRLLFLPRYISLLLVAVIAGPLLFYAGFAIIKAMRDPASTPISTKTIVSNGATRWIGDKKITASSFVFSSPGSQTVGISPLFA